MPLRWREGETDDDRQLDVTHGNGFDTKTRGRDEKETEATIHDPIHRRRSKPEARSSKRIFRVISRGGRNERPATGDGAVRIANDVIVHQSIEVSREIVEEKLPRRRHARERVRNEMVVEKEKKRKRATRGARGSKRILKRISYVRIFASGNNARRKKRIQRTVQYRYVDYYCADRRQGVLLMTSSFIKQSKS